MNIKFRRIDEKTQAPQFPDIRQFDASLRNQGVSICGMDYKKEAGRRLRIARKDKGWTLGDLSRETGDLLDLKRIAQYEVGRRAVGPTEAAILAKTLGVRIPYIMAVDDNQLPISPQEENLIRNWRKLAEKDRMTFFRQIESSAMQSADPVTDLKVSQHLGPVGGAKEKKRAPLAHKKA